MVNRFKPIPLVIENDLLMQTVEDSIRYWNSHSAFPVFSMFDYGGVATQLTADFKEVVQVYPASDPTGGFTFRDTPMWSLLGLTILDSVTSNLISLSHYYQNFKVYTGGDFRWNYVPVDDPTLGGKLYVQGFPSGASKMAVLGSKRILATEDIKNEHVIDWLTKYTLAHVKQLEGNLYRKGGFVGMNTDGDKLVEEGKADQEKLEKKLEEEGRWVIVGKRI